MVIILDLEIKIVIFTFCQATLPFNPISIVTDMSLSKAGRIILSVLAEAKQTFLRFKKVKGITIRIVHRITFSEFAFMRFMSSNMLTKEESQHKDEIVDLTEQVLDAKGLECDERISKLSEEKLREILEEVRKLRKRRRSINDDDSNKEEVLYVNT
jgi:hypothetical protein